MKPTSKILTGALLSPLFLLPPPVARAAAKEARVTQIVRDVKLLPSEAPARPAAVNDKVSQDTGVRTGGESRSELTFPDLTITRLGSNTIFSFTAGGHTAKVDSGSILLRVPKDSGGGSIKSSAVTVAVTGTTVIFEKGGGTKSRLMTLEGSARVALVAKPKDFRTVRASQMLDVPAGATTLPMPVNIDLNDVMRNHPLITDFKPLPSQPLIMAAAQQPPPAPPPNYTGPNISIDIGGVLGGGTNTGPRGPRPRPSATPPSNSRPPGTKPPSTRPPPPPQNNPTPPPPTTNQPPGRTKYPPSTTTTNTIPRNQTTVPPRKVTKPKPSSTPPQLR